MCAAYVDTCMMSFCFLFRSLCAYLAAANCFTKSHVESDEVQTLMQKAQYYYISVSIFVCIIIGYSPFSDIVGLPLVDVVVYPLP